MKSFSSICEKVPRSAIRKMFAMADKIEDPISFAIGEPDFTTPSHIIDAANRALSSGETHYTPNIGILPLRQAIADYRNAMGLGYDPSNEIMITAGGMEALYLSLLVLLNPGDEVLLSNPGWTNYYGQILMCRAIPKRVPAYESEGFIVTPEELKKAITPKTKLLILNSPSNPTGGVATPERLEAIAKLCVEEDLYVLSDEVYHRLLYADAPFVSIASFPGMKERTVIIDSFSKTYAMTGWRVGMALGPESILSMMVKFQENVAACVNTAAQFGALEALCGAQDCVEEMLQTYAQRRKVLVEGLNSIPHLTCIEPKGAFYAFPNITATGLTSEEFAMQLLQSTGVITVPGTGFGSAGEGFVRLSYATSTENILRGLERMEKFVLSLG